jgi:peptide/nickel transport system substrate-binding protein
VSWLAANQNGTGTPPSTPTGTLTIAGDTDVAGMLIPQAEYDTIGYTVLLAMDRTVVGYPPSTNFSTATSIVADAASSYTASSDGLTYTFKIRSGMRWAVTDPTTGAQVTSDNGTTVTSQDFVRGLQEECNPAIAGYGNPSYYTATIKGYSDFCSSFESQPATDTAAQLAAFMSANSISGLSTPNSSTLVVTLTDPASDFLNIMAMFFAAAAPPSSVDYVPLTAGNPIWSDGPYEVQTYTPGTKIVLVPNPYWGATSGTNATATSWSNDPNRHRYVAEISIDESLSSSASADEVQQEIEAGTLNLEWDTVVPSSSLPTLANHSNSEFGSFPSPGTTNPYLVFNVQKSGPIKNVKVRQALEYAIDKVAMGKFYGGASINQPLNQVIGPGAEGYVQFNDYPTNNNQGNPGKCKSLLAAAGYPNGITLKDYYRNSGNHPAVFQEVQSDFQKCGVTVVGTPIATGYYGSSGIGVTSPNGLKAGKWDITEPGWGPDWFSPTNGRSILPDILDGALSFPGSDWGGFDDPAVDALVTQAEAATTISAAANYWHQADMQVMKDAAFIPFQTQLQAIYHSPRVHNAIYLPFSEQYDITQIWLSS